MRLNNPLSPWEGNLDHAAYLNLTAYGTYWLRAIEKGIGNKAAFIINEFVRCLAD